MRIRRTRATSTTDRADRPAAAPFGPSGDDGFGRRLRVLTGVEEELLGRVRTERARYTALAAVMVCTAAIGGCSMYFALAEILGEAEFWFVPAALGWGTFVLCLDRWLVSSSGGARWRTRASVLGPRLVVACFFGFLIAEPIVLRVFEPSVLSSVRHERQETIDTLRKGLLECNRSPLEAAASGPAAIDCTTLRLGMTGAVGAEAAKLDGLRSQAKDLKARIDGEQGKLDGLRETVNKECNGTSGTGLTGRAGNGPACQYDQEAVRDFTAANPIEQQIRDLEDLNHRITDASDGQSGTEADFQAARAKKIDERLAKEDSPDGLVGIGDRFDALFALASRSGFIGAASWLVRIFFVLIDCMPVLVKFFSGATAYDRLVEIEIASAEKLYTDETRADEAAAEERLKTELHEIRAHAERRRMEIDLETRRHADDQQARQQRAVDDLWERKLGQRRTTPFGSDRPARPARPQAAPEPVPAAHVPAAHGAGGSGAGVAGAGVSRTGPADAEPFDGEALDRLFAAKLAAKRAARPAPADAATGPAAGPEPRPGRGPGPVSPVPWSALKQLSDDAPRHTRVNGHRI
ncbi:DUF4407 domain-containing protein [Kitasatospora paranensis]|uniref:DUF4407 domain-containing protein n=1 Tax=Kitasatospora paranensis TaxID=258053 RepID=A0ABW2GAB1_9ACTN